jgi:hypothetical protein
MKSMKDLIAETKVKGDVVPPGWKTRQQWAQELGMSSSMVGVYLDRLLKEKKVEAKRFKVSMGLRSAYPVPHYRVRPSKKR